MANLKLSANVRNERGSRAARRLRREGLVPGVVYGKGEEATSFTVEDREFRRLLREGAAVNVVELTVGGESAIPTLLKDLQRDPIRGDLIHIDLQEVDLTATIDTSVPIITIGSPVGVKEGGILDQTLREIVIRALPTDIPEHIEIDVTALDVGDSITVADLTPPAGVEIVDDPEASVASIVLPRAAVEEEPAEGEELEEGEEPAEGEGGAEDGGDESDGDSGDE